MLRGDTFFPTLVTKVPEFQATIDEHLQENDELLPHVLMGDFTRFVLRMFHESIDEQPVTKCKRDILVTSLDFLEEALATGDSDVVELISLSFLENLADQEDLDQLKPLFGPRLRQELQDHFE